jgi:hypothetical protein
MKSLRSVSAAAVLISLSIAAFAQSDTQKAVAQSDAQKSFDKLKTLAGTWQGSAKADPPQPDWDNSPVQVTMRITSRGNALVHEMQDPKTPDDPTKYDHPVTMVYVDGDQLNLVHYCDAGNRPRMVAKASSPDGKTVEFAFADLSGGNDYGHMHHALFTFIDANHHVEDWTYLEPGDKVVHAHMDLQRVK